MNTTATLNKEKCHMPLLTASSAGKNQCPSFDWLQGWARVFKTNHRVPEVKRVHDARLRNKEGGRGGEELKHLHSLFI